MYVGKDLYDLQVEGALELGIKMGMLSFGPSLYGYKAKAQIAALTCPRQASWNAVYCDIQRIQY